MPQLNEEHFEVIDRNNDISLQRTKIKYLEDRISKLERVLESHAKCIGELRGTESRIHDLISLKGDNNA